MRTRDRASLDSTCIVDLFFEIRVSLIQIQFFNPDVAKPDVMSFRLQLEPLRRVGDAFAVIIAAVHARVRAAPNLTDGDLVMDLYAIEIHADHGLLHQLSDFEARRAEYDVVCIP